MKNLVSDIHDYFLPNGHKKTLDSFLRTLPNYVIDVKDGVEKINYSLALQVSRLCNFLVNDELLINTSYNPMICTENEYVSVPINGFDEPEKLRRDIAYGAYDFKFNGFFSVFEEFKGSVIPIVGINKKTMTAASISTDTQRLMTKSVTGQVVANSTSYMSSLDYFIINARVKGGNSGSPVINEYGKVIGTVFELPFDAQEGSQTGRYDIMGFGVCLPSKYIKQLCENKVSFRLKNEEWYII